MDIRFKTSSGELYEVDWRDKEGTTFGKVDATKNAALLGDAAV